MIGEPYYQDEVPPFLVLGHATTFSPHPWVLTRDEERDLADEFIADEERRIPLGFALPCD